MWLLLLWAGGHGDPLPGVPGDEGGAEVQGEG